MLAYSNQKPPVIILAAGENSRMFPLETWRHKGLIELHGQSILRRTLDTLVKEGYRDCCIVLSSRDFQASEVQDWFEQTSLALGESVTLRLVEQRKPTGMGDAVLTAYHHHDSLKTAPHIAVIAPYSIDAGDILNQLQKKTLQHETMHAITVTETDRPWEYGIVTVVDELAQAIVEKPEKGTEPAKTKIQMTYVLGQSFIDQLKMVEPSQYSFEAALTEIIKTESVAVLQTDQPLLTLKYAWDLFAFQKHFFRDQKTTIAASATVARTAIIDDSRGPVIIEADAHVGDFAKIVGPSYIGRQAFIGDYSFIRQSSIEPEATIGAKTELVRSIVMAGASLHYAFVADSIIGIDAKIGAGLITANKRFDRNHVRTNINDKRVEFPTNAFGCVIGQKASLGVGVRTMPGVLIASQSQIEPNTVLSKNVVQSNINHIQ